MLAKKLFSLSSLIGFSVLPSYSSEKTPSAGSVSAVDVVNSKNVFKNGLIKLFTASLLSLAIISPSFADSTSISITATVVSAVNFDIDTPDNRVFKTSDAGDFPVSREITQISNIIDFGNIDKYGKNKGSGIVDQISLLNNDKLIDKKEEKKAMGAAYIIGSSEADYALKLNFGSQDAANNIDVTVNKEGGSKLDLYYSDSEISWKNSVKLGDREHPELSENPTKINKVGNNGEITLDIAAKVIDEKMPAQKATTILFTIDNNLNS
jgi:hypothetical protein